MKSIIIAIVLMIAGITAHGQSWTPAQYTQAKGLVADSAMRAPRADTIWKGGTKDSVGAIVYRPADSTLYFKRLSGWASFAIGGNLSNYWDSTQVKDNVYTKDETDGRYILNNIATEQAANFNISGNGVLGGSVIAAGGTFDAVTSGIVWTPRVNSGDDVGALYLDGGNSSGAIGSSIVLRGGTYASTPGAMSFHTGTGTGSLQPERMRIDAAGNVGIRTTTPTAPLDVVGKIKTNDTAEAKVFHLAGTQGHLYVNDLGVGPNSVVRFTTNNKPIWFTVNGTDFPLYITSTGIAQSNGMGANFSQLYASGNLQEQMQGITSDVTVDGGITFINVATTGNPVVTLPASPGHGRIIRLINAPANAGNYCTWTPAAHLDGTTDVSSFNDPALGGTSCITLQYSSGTPGGWWIVSH